MQNLATANIINPYKKYFLFLGITVLVLIIITAAALAFDFGTKRQINSPAVSSASSTASAQITSSSSSAQITREPVVKDFSNIEIADGFTARKVNFKVYDPTKVYLRGVPGNGSIKEGVFIESEDYFFALLMYPENFSGFKLKQSTKFELPDSKHILFFEIPKDRLNHVPVKYTTEFNPMQIVDYLGEYSCAKAKATPLPWNPDPLKCNAEDKFLYTTEAASLGTTETYANIFCLYKNDAAKTTCLNIYKSVRFNAAPYRESKLKLDEERVLFKQ
jgi:hypothetical protein